MPILPVTTASDGTYQTVCVDNCLDECSRRGSIKEGLFLAQDPHECTWTLIQNRNATPTRMVLVNVVACRQWFTRTGTPARSIAAIQLLHDFEYSLKVCNCTVGYEILYKSSIIIRTKVSGRIILNAPCVVICEAKNWSSLSHKKRSLAVSLIE